MELTDKLIFTARNEIFSSNTYLLKSKFDNTCLLIDPGLDTGIIDAEITALGLTPIAVIATHGHFDHIGSVSFFKQKFNIPYYLHEADLKISQSANFYLKIARINMKIETPKPDVLFSGRQQSITVGGFNLNIYNFPGHSAGSCIVQHENNLFSGDTIYKKGLGFNNFPGEDQIKLRQSILEIFETFPGDSLILPGHGEAEYLQNIKNNNHDLIKFLI